MRTRGDNHLATAALAALVACGGSEAVARAQPEPPAAPGPPTEAEPPHRAPAGSAAIEPVDIVVAGPPRPKPPRREASAARLADAEIRRVPGAFGDAFRAIEVVPGLTPLAAGLPYFFMRGATPAASGYFLDDMPVPFLFHLGVGPSVVNPALVDRLDVMSGGYPARYGRFVGGVVVATTREPPPRPTAEATVRVFDAGAVVAAPFDEGRADAFAGGRYSYTAAALSLLSRDVLLSYWDYQAGGGYRVAPRDRVSLFAFGSHDFLGRTVSDEERTSFAAQFHRVELRLDHGARAGDRPVAGAVSPPRLRLAVMAGYDRSELGEEVVVTQPLYGVRLDVEAPLSRAATLRTGADMNAAHVSLDDSSATPEAKTEEDFQRNFTRSFGEHQATTLGAYLDFVLRPHPVVELVPGARVDVFTESGLRRAALDPRGAVRLKVAPAVTTVTTAGLVHQRPTFLLPAPGLEPRGLDAGLQEALQLGQGVELALPGSVSATATVFHHTYWDLSDLTATCSAEVKECKVEDRADGRAYGVELAVSRPLSKDVGGLVSYTLSRSERTIHRTFVADFDRTHVLHTVIGWAFAPGWHAGARLSVYSGRPYSLLKFDRPDKPDLPTLVGKRNALRRDALHQVDLRLEKRWRLGQTGWIALVLEGLNVTLQKEVVDFDCRVTDVGSAASDLSCAGEEIGPIAIPSIGVSAGF